MSYPIAEKRPLRIGHRGAAAYAPHNTLTSFRKAAELKPNLAEAHFGLGVVYGLLERNDEAIRELTRFQELDTGKDPIATENAAAYLEQLRGQ